MHDFTKMFQGKRYTVYGLGLNGGGVGVARFLARAGARVTVTDAKTREQLALSVESLREFPAITFVLGSQREEDFTDTDGVILSPAIPWTNPFVQRALGAGVPVDMDSSLFFRLCDRPIIGVTGTKGKTSTSTFLHTLLCAADVDARLAGVSREPVLPLLETLEEQSVVVFELSSWRLSALGRIQKSPHIAVFTNFLPDHLNYYATMDAYFEDKRFVYRFQSDKDFVILNADDEKLRSVVEEVAARKIFFSREDAGRENAVFVRAGDIMLRFEGKEECIADTASLRVRGEHTALDLLAAIAAARAYGLSIADIRRGVSQCHGVEHRLEWVREVNGVGYYNDTAATIPDAAISGIESFSEPIVLIAGGSNKNVSYEAMAKIVIARTKCVILLSGEASSALLTAIQREKGDNFHAEDFPIAGSMHEAVCLAKSFARKGDIVLLSPGAASFGMFANEFDRGEQFRAEVNRIAFLP